MIMNSCVYNGLVTHKRFKPVKHFLKYKTFSILLDLDEIEKLDKRISIFSFNKFNIYSFYNKDVNERTAYISIVIGLISGFLLFPFPDFSKSLLVGVLISKELFSPFILQSLLFLSFIVATFLPAIILKIKRN